MLPVDEIFELVVDSAFVGIREPDPEIYELTVERLGATDTYTQPGRAIADISHVRIEYWPGLSVKPTRKTR